MNLLKSVAIIGRPNVGKSCLFNKLAGKKISIIDDTPGVTRDRIYADVEWLDKKFVLIDTGGLEPDSDKLINKFIFEQAKIALETCDLILFLLDGRTGITNLDKDITNILRAYKSKKNILLVINKIDDFRRDKNLIYEFYNLGFGEPIPVSAEGSLGLGDLLDQIINSLYPKDNNNNNNNKNNNLDDLKESEIIKVALIGKPNVGKSSIINKILNQDRLIVSDMPGTTRDAVDSLFIYNKQKYIFIDTAGIRKKHKVKEALEYYSVVRSISAVERANVCVLVIDAEENITEQDTKIAGISHNKNKPAIILINKWDKIQKDNKTLNKFLDIINQKLAYMPYAPKLFVSALTGQRLIKIFELINTVWANANTRIKTGILNELLLEAITMNPTKVDKGQQLKIYYITQVSVCPPTFMLSVNNSELMHFSYKRYLENQIRSAFGFIGTPINFIIKNKK